MALYVAGQQVGGMAVARQALPQLHLNGPEYGVEYTDATGDFSNANPGVVGTDYKYDSQATVDFIASRGWRTVKLPIRWERIQPTLYGGLDYAELGRLTDFIGMCETAGLSVNLDVHNYGLYYHDVAGVGTRTAIGGTETPVAAFVDLWSRLAGVFKDSSTVTVYNLMAEPQGDYGNLTADTWHTASQDAVNAIRQVDQATEIHVGGFGWSSLRWWELYNPDPWIVDPADNFRYVAHHYWDGTGGGSYVESYAAEVNASTLEGNVAGDNPTALHSRILEELEEWAQWLDTHGVRGIVGELGWPHDDSSWHSLADWYLGHATRLNIPVVHWAAGEWVGDWATLRVYSGSPVGQQTGASLIAEKHLTPTITIGAAHVWYGEEWVMVYQNRKPLITQPFTLTSVSGNGTAHPLVPINVPAGETWAVSVQGTLTSTNYLGAAPSVRIGGQSNTVTFGSPTTSVNRTGTVSSGQGVALVSAGTARYDFVGTVTIDPNPV